MKNEMRGTGYTSKATKVLKQTKQKLIRLFALFFQVFLRIFSFESLSLSTGFIEEISRMSGTDVKDICYQGLI